MRWRVEHPLSVSLDEALAAALDARTLTRIHEFMPQVTSATRRSQETVREGLVRVVDRFEPAMEPPAFARGVTRDMLGWDLCLDWDLASYAAGFVIDPHVKPEWKRYASAAGVYRFEARRGGCVRVIDAELEIRVGMAGALAERFAVRMLSQQFAGEARLLEASALSRRLAGCRATG